MTTTIPHPGVTGRSTCLVLACVLAMAGCSDKGTDIVAVDDGGTGGSEAVSFAARIQPIFDANCVACHGAGGNGGLDLRPGSAYANLVGVTSPTYGRIRVVPGDSGASLLYLKTSGAAGVGSVMPPTGGLAGSTLDLIERWIDEGAANN